MSVGPKRCVYTLDGEAFSGLGELAGAGESWQVAPGRQELGGVATKKVGVEHEVSSPGYRGIRAVILAGDLVRFSKERAHLIGENMCGRAHQRGALYGACCSLGD